MQQISPAELALWCQRTLPDDTRSFEVLVSTYKQRVFATAYRLLGDRAEAEDAAQEVFLKVYKAIKDLAVPATLTSWIYKITTRTCLDLIESRNRRSAITRFTEAVDDDGESPSYADPSNQTPESIAVTKELRKCLEKTLAELDMPARSVLVLRDIEECSYHEIAEALAIGLSAVKMRIHRARLAFQETLSKICPGVAKLNFTKS